MRGSTMESAMLQPSSSSFLQSLARFGFGIAVPPQAANTAIAAVTVARCQPGWRPVAAVLSPAGRRRFPIQRWPPSWP